MTPDQVGDLSLATFNRIPHIAAMADEIRREEQEKAAKG
jgi:hypothetical protein